MVFVTWCVVTGLLLGSRRRVVLRLRRWPWLVALYVFVMLSVAFWGGLVVPLRTGLDEHEAVVSRDMDSTNLSEFLDTQSGRAVQTSIALSSGFTLIFAYRRRHEGANWPDSRR